MAKFWPLSSDYADAVQWPDVSCADPELKAAKVATLANGLPRPPCAGNFADVYQFRSQDGQKLWAVKCFTRRIAGLTERYREISRQLEAARLPFTVAFKYLEQGMLIRGEWFPVLKMDWVEGLTLRQFVEQNLQKPRMLNVLFQIWLKVEPLLRQVGVAHGDLQYGNVMLVPGSSEGKLALRLIDYDGMWVRSLAGQPPGEVGHPSFQHPQRAKQNVYSPEIDRFPLLVIACALRCLARPGGERLWKDYDTGDNLLFTKPDFETPTKSKLLLELWNSGDSELHSWVGHLVNASQAPLETVPLLSTLVNEGRIRPLSDAEEQSVRSILGSATPVAETDLKSGAETDWWDAELAESLAEDAGDELTEEIDDELIEEIEPEPVVRPGKQVGNRIQSGGRRTKQTTEAERDSERPVALWVWAAAGVLVTSLFIGLYLGTRGHDPQTETVSTSTNAASSEANSNKTIAPEPDPDWDPANVRELASFSGIAGTSFSFHADGNQLVSVSEQPRSNAAAFNETWAQLNKWDISSGQVTTVKLNEPTGRLAAMALSADANRLALASGNENRTVMVWDAKNGRRTQTLNGHANEVISLAFSPDGSRLASGSKDRSVKVWDTNSGQEVLTLKSLPGVVRSLAFSGDGKRLASVSGDVLSGKPDEVMIWDAMNGQRTLTLNGHAGTITSVTFSANGQWLASASTDQTVKVWDTSMGREVLTLKGHTGAVYCVAFSENGNWLATGSVDETLKMWNVANGRETLTLKGHSSAIRSVKFRADGKRLASASANGTIKLWGVDRINAQSLESPVEPKLTESPQPAPAPDSDPAQIRELATLSAHTGAVSCVAITADGKRLASASSDQTVKVWDTMSGQELLTLKGHTNWVTSVAFSADGKWLASASQDQTVKVWYALSGQERLTLKGHTNQVTSVAFSADGKRLASASVDQTVKVWDVTSGQATLTLEGHTGFVQSVAFSADGKWLASASHDLTVKVWDATSGQEMLTLKGHNNLVQSVATSPSGNRLASAGDDDTLNVWDATSGQVTLTLKGHNSFVRSVAFSPDGKRLASASMDQTVKLWDATSGQETLTLKGHSQPVNSVAFSPDGKWLASASEDKTVKIWGSERPKATALDSPSGSKLTKNPKPEPASNWDPAHVRELATLTGHSAAVTSVAFSGDGKRLASASGDKSVKVWDATSGQETLTLKGHTGGVAGVAFRADGNVLASASRNATNNSAAPGQIKLWNAVSGKETRTLTGHTGGVVNVAFSADGSRLASASEDRTVKVWGVTSGKETLSLNGHTDQVLSVAFRADGKRLATASMDQTVKMWDTVNGQVTQTLKGHTNAVYGVAFSFDGKRLASASQDGTVKVWDATSGRELLTLKDNSAFHCVAFSPDGKWLASPKNENVIVWDATSGQETLTLRGHTDSILGIAFSADGKLLASGSQDATVKLWGAIAAASDSKDSEVALPNTPTGTTSPLPANSPSANQSAETPKAGSNLFSRIADALLPKPEAVPNGVSKTDSNVSEIRELAVLTGLQKAARRVAFSPDGQRLASTSDLTINLWDARTGAKLHVLKNNTGDTNWYSVLDLRFSADSQRLVARSDKRFKIWSVHSGADRRMGTPDFSGPEYHAVLGISPDGLWQASSSGNYVSLTLRRNNSSRNLSSNRDDIYCFQFSPDSQWIASAGEDRTIRLWDVQRGDLLRTLQGHTSTVLSLCFSPDGQRLASASSDGTIRLWNTQSGVLLRMINAHPEGALCVSFGPDSQHFVSSGADKTVKLWGPGSPLPPAPPGEFTPAEGILERPTSPEGTFEYVVQFIAAHLAVGEPTEMAEFISPKCKGLLGDIRDDKVTDAQLEEFKSLFVKATAVGKARTEEGLKVMTLRNGDGSTVTFRAKKEGEDFKIVEMTFKRSTTKKAKSSL